MRRQHQNLFRSPQRKTAQRGRLRQGNIVVLCAAFIVMIFGFTAFAVDVGFILLTKTQLQSAADGGSLAATAELADGLVFFPDESSMTVDSMARAAASNVVSLNRAGEKESIYLDPERDVRVGRYEWDPQTNAWEMSWGATPYNMVEISLHRGVAGSDGEASPTDGDSELPLFFSPVMGHKSAKLSTKAVAAMLPGVGFRVTSGTTNADVLPITLDVGTWTNLLNGIGDGDFSYDPDTGQISDGPDGILEVNLYPTGSSSLPPGNRGTVDFGNSNNSTDDLKRQILYGLSASDLSYFGGELTTENGPLFINGDTGLSAGIKAELEAVKGIPKAISLFTEVSGPGNNATYTIVQFVGVRIMDVKLTGGSKWVTVQPAVLIDHTVIPGKIEVDDATIFTFPKLIRQDG